LKRIKLNEHKVAVPLPVKSAKNYIELNKQRIKQQSEKNQGHLVRSNSEAKTTFLGSTKLGAIKQAIGGCLVARKQNNLQKICKENKEPLVEQMGKLSISKSQVLIPP